MRESKKMYIETNSLTKKYGTKAAVDNVSIHVEEGKIYGLVGKNGAGKTTLMKLLTGLALPTSGSILNQEKLKKVGVLIETPGLYPGKTCFDNLKIKMLMAGTFSVEKCMHLLEIVGLKDSAKLKAKKLSLGMKQRLSIAMALSTGSDLLILDEPMNGLDPDGMMEMRNILIALKNKGMTILISSHLLSELEKFADTFGFMDDGKLLTEVNKSDVEGSLEDLYIKLTHKEVKI